MKTKRSKKELLLHDAIIATLVWFNFRRRPLELDEIYNFLFKKTASYESVKKEIEKMGLTSNNGEYALSQFKTIHYSYDSLLWVKEKWQIANRGARLLSWIPWIKLVGVCNSLADQTAKPESDIDFFIISSRNRLFITRFLATTALGLFGLWRHKGNITNKICLSWYISEDSLNLWSVSQKQKDILLAYWISQLTPLINRNNMYARFIVANRWASDFLPNWQSQVRNTGKQNRYIQIFFINWIEQLLKSFQMQKIRKNNQSADPDVKIIVTNTMLKFHEIDRRRIYREQWLLECKKAGIKNPDLLLN